MVPLIGEQAFGTQAIEEPLKVQSSKSTVVINTPFLIGKMGRTAVELRLKVSVLAVIHTYAKGQENPRHKVVSTQGKTDQSPRREGGVLSMVLKEVS